MCSSGSEAAFSICFVTMSTGPAGELCTQRGGCLMTTSPPKPRAVGEQTGTSNHRQRAGGAPAPRVFRSSFLTEGLERPYFGGSCLPLPAGEGRQEADRILRVWRDHHCRHTAGRTMDVRLRTIATEGSLPKTVSHRTLPPAVLSSLGFCLSRLVKTGLAVLSSTGIPHRTLPWLKIPRSITQTLH